MKEKNNKNAKIGGSFWLKKTTKDLLNALTI